MHNRLYDRPSKKSGSVLQEIVGRRFYAFGNILRVSNLVDRLVSYHTIKVFEDNPNYLTDCEIERLKVIKAELDTMFKNRHTKYLLIKEAHDKINRTTSSNKESV
jgi:hypothetical protein